MAPGSKQRIVEHLQRVSSATVSELAATCSVTTAAVRQHLEHLESVGVVERDASTPPAGTRGRPATTWRLCASAPTGFPESFPDRHVDLVVDLIDSIVARHGSDALDRVLAERGDRQAEKYCEQVDTHRPLHERVARLAAARDAEGYVAEVISHPDGSTSLIEHHCAISAAAVACPRLCDSELAVFRRVLGINAHVEREQHALAGDGRCSFRVTSVV